MIRFLFFHGRMCLLGCKHETKLLVYRFDSHNNFCLTNLFGLQLMENKHKCAFREHVLHKNISYRLLSKFIHENKEPAISVLFIVSSISFYLDSLITYIFMCKSYIFIVVMRLSNMLYAIQILSYISVRSINKIFDIRL